jgi:hypothetical protein
MRFAWFVPLALGACSLGTSDNSPQAQCDRQADNDPRVQWIYGGHEGDYTIQGSARANLLWAKRQALEKCLREKGLAPPGGVEPVKPRM